MVDCNLPSSFLQNYRTIADSACIKAIETQLDGITFMGHLDTSSPACLSNFVTNYDIYCEYLYDLKVKYRDKLFIYLGIEIEASSNYFEDALWITHNYDFDHVLLSVPLSDSISFYDRYDQEKDIGPDNKFYRYLNNLIYAARKFKNFDTIAHFERVFKNVSYCAKSVNDYEYVDIIDELFKTLGSNRKGLEIDTSYRGDATNEKKYNECCITLIQRFYEMGGEYISFGSYSDSPSTIGCNFDYYWQILTHTHFDYTIHYTNRNPMYDS